ncbi:DNA repair protein recA-like 3, mitochondrial [Canna indica]|uniref:DNA repair protein recA-like 3, mitochondrial n=1 Tax=Canna indica TaxID=4628 RepID=A0AAQ3KDT8_9LILI|nr:DNA repair protein recA-like 3, mitochondrial [Canna indica]
MERDLFSWRGELLPFPYSYFIEKLIWYRGCRAPHGIRRALYARILNAKMLLTLQWCGQETDDLLKELQAAVANKEIKAEHIWGIWWTSEVTIGDNALKFYAFVCLNIKGIGFVKKGGEVHAKDSSYLTHYYLTTKVLVLVAKGILKSTNQSTRVGGHELGDEWCEVHIEESID